VSEERKRIERILENYIHDDSIEPVTNQILAAIEEEGYICVDEEARKAIMEAQTKMYEDWLKGKG